jgi:chromosome segregation ATPase
MKKILVLTLLVGAFSTVQCREFMPEEQADVILDVDGNPTARPTSQQVEMSLQRARAAVARVNQDTDRQVAMAQQQAARASAVLNKIQGLEADAAAIDQAIQETNRTLAQLNRKKNELAAQEMNVRNTQTKLDKQSNGLRQHIARLRQSLEVRVR